jgi:hypothetical protein
MGHRQVNDEPDTIQTDASDSTPGATGVPQFHGVRLPVSKPIGFDLVPLEDVLHAHFASGVEVNHA